MNGILGYVSSESAIAALNPLVKAACALALAFAVFSSPSLAVSCAVLALGLLCAARCSLLRQAVSLVGAVAAFSAVLAAIALMFTPSGEVLAVLPWGYIGTGSVHAALLAVLRLCACSVPLYVAMRTSRMADFANASVKMLGVPYRYAFAFSSAVRFIPSLLEDMAAVMEAQQARGVVFDGGIVRKVRLMVPLCIPLLLEGVRRSERIATAARVRGFDLRTRESGSKAYPLAIRDAVAVTVCIAIAAASLFAL